MKLTTNRDTSAAVLAVGLVFAFVLGIVFLGGCDQLRDLPMKVDAPTK